MTWIDLTFTRLHCSEKESATMQYPIGRFVVIIGTGSQVPQRRFFMNRFILGTALAAILALTPFTHAKKEGSSNSDGGINGKIQSISNTLLSVGTGHGHGRHHRLKPIVVHYNPESTTVMLDGVRVGVLDVASIGKYVSITGTMHDNLFEATSITVTSSAPSQPARKSKSKNT
jgi:hypothetical protein